MVGCVVVGGGVDCCEWFKVGVWVCFIVCWGGLWCEVVLLCGVGDYVGIGYGGSFYLCDCGVGGVDGVFELLNFIVENL